jgi:ankyrin repeat protein
MKKGIRQGKVGKESQRVHEVTPEKPEEEEGEILEVTEGGFDIDGKKSKCCNKCDKLATRSCPKCGEISWCGQECFLELWPSHKQTCTAHPTLKSVLRGDNTMLKEALKKISDKGDDVKKEINDNNPHQGMTALQAVFCYNIPDPVRLALLITLLEAGADPNVGTSKHPEPPVELPLVMGLKNASEFIRLMLEAGGKPTAMSLFQAVIHNETGILSALLEAGGDPNITSEKLKWSLLDAAVIRGDLATLQLLFKHKADPNLTCEEGGNVPILIRAVSSQATLEMVLALIGAGCDVNVTGNAISGGGKSTLHYAAEQRNLPLIKALVEAGADVNIRSSKAGGNKTALGYVTEGTKQWVEMTISKSQKWSPEQRKQVQEFIAEYNDIGAYLKAHKGKE